MPAHGSRRKESGWSGREKLQNVRRPDCALLAGANSQSADGGQVKRQLVGVAREIASRVLVPGLAKSAFEGEPPHQLVGDQRDPRLAENFLRVIEPRMGKTCSPKPAMSPVCENASGSKSTVSFRYSAPTLIAEPSSDQGLPIPQRSSWTVAFTLPTCCLNDPRMDGGIDKIGDGLRRHLPVANTSQGTQSASAPGAEGPSSRAISTERQRVGRSKDRKRRRAPGQGV